MKKQSVITILLTVLMSMAGATAFAHVIEVKNSDGVTIYFDWINNNTELAVSCRGSGYNSYSNEYTGDVVIPKSVDYNGSAYPVTSIRVQAFSGCSGLTSVTIPNSVATIGTEAFNNCSSLTSVTIPSSVESIGNLAFSGCSGLTSIKVESGNPKYDSRNNCNAIIETSSNTLIAGCKNTIIPNNVTSIDEYAFSGCSGLTSVTIPNSVTSIGRYAFSGTAWFNNQPDGLVYAGKVAYGYKGDMPENTSLIIKDGTVGIADYAFSRCAGLTSVTIPNSVTSIGGRAFEDCSGLTSIKVESGNPKYDSRNNCNAIIELSSNTLIAGCKNTVIPNNVTSIGAAAFSGCSGLTSITIPNSVTSIGGSAFSGCSGLTSIIIPNSVTSIGGFQNCSGLTSVTIPNSVTDIDSYAFWLCTGLTSVTIPNSVTSIHFQAFCHCDRLTSVTISNNITYISPHAFMKCDCLSSVNVPVTDFSAFCNNKVVSEIRDELSLSEINASIQLIDSEGKKITEYIVPNDVTSIGERAFTGCSSLTSVAIPNSVTSIGKRAFSGCNCLTSVTIPNSVTSIGDDAFSYCSVLTTIVSEIKTPFEIGNMGGTSATLIVPAGTKAAYQSTTGWSSFTQVVEVGEGGVVGCKFEIDGIYYTIGENNTASLTSANKAISGAIVIPSQVDFNGKKYDVTSIGYGAFSYCTGLTSVTIPNSVTSIGERAFYGCSSIKLVKSFISEPYSIDKSVFHNEVYSQSSLYIPAGTETLYTQLDGWKEFLNKEEMDDFEEQEIPGAEKCATPTISYENDKLSFSCQTEGVDFKYKIEANDAKRGYGNDIQMTRDYKVTVIAFKDGMNNSDPAIIIIGKKGDVNGDNKVDVADHVELSNIILNQQGSE